MTVERLAKNRSTSGSRKSSTSLDEMIRRCDNRYRANEILRSKSSSQMFPPKSQAMETSKVQKRCDRSHKVAPIRRRNEKRIGPGDDASVEPSSSPRNYTRGRNMDRSRRTTKRSKSPERRHRVERRARAGNKASKEHSRSIKRQKSASIPRF